MSAASADAPLGSSTSFIRSNTNRMVSMISSSVTTTISSTCSRMTAKVLSPADVVLLSVCDRARRIDFNNAIFRKRSLHVVAGRRFDTDDPGRIRMSLGNRCAPGDEATAANAHDDGVKRASLLEQLLGNRSLTSNHIPVVEGVYQRHASLLGEVVA